MTTSGKKKPVRILIADDNKEMRDTVIRLLDPEFDIVGVAADGQSLIDLEEKLHPAIGIIDISMPVMSGIDAARTLKKRGSEMRIVFLTVHEDSDFVKAAMDCGASAYVLKRGLARELATALHCVQDGKIYISPSCPV